MLMKPQDDQRNLNERFSEFNPLIRAPMAVGLFLLQGDVDPIAIRVTVKQTSAFHSPTSHVPPPTSDSVQWLAQKMLGSWIGL